MIKLEKDNVIPNNILYVLYNKKTKEILDYEFDTERLDDLYLLYSTDKIDGIDSVEYNDDLGGYVLKYTGETPFENIVVATVCGDFKINSIVEN